MREKLAAVFASMFNVADISDDMKIDCLEGWDSYAHVELILELEDAFGISIPTNDAVEITSVKKILEYLEIKLGGKA